jgi:hypothetical protein
MTQCSVVYDNYDDFQHVDFIFSQNFISLFWGLFKDETDLRVRYVFFEKDLKQVLSGMFKSQYPPIANV